MDHLEEIHIKKVLGPTQTGTAVLLGNADKTFVMFIGHYEGAALMRELNDERPARPLTHELISYVLDGFNVEIRKIVITDLVENTFCATLVLEQRVIDKDGEWVGKRNEVRIDARPSDCLILALKEKRPIYCTRAVLEKVRDVSQEVGLAETADDEGVDGPGFTKPDFLGGDWSGSDTDLGSEDDEDLV
jgi:bifunctional DNase/RNase